MTFEFPGRPHLEGSRKVIKKAHPTLRDMAMLFIYPVEMRDAGLIRCVTNKGSAEIELVVYAEEKVRNPKVEVISRDSVLVSWQAPSNAEGLLVAYDVLARSLPTNVTKFSKIVNTPSKNGFESLILTGITPGNYRISIKSIYKSGFYSALDVCSIFDLFLHFECKSRRRFFFNVFVYIPGYQRAYY
ncbi:hypothetical protein ElyMa_005007700 [Elysia marginata]|uniref:Fibronectin type-III domain-containing protein n=1 Tax=Elysia marginata TaxID=1093978 RepID=A0AAV4J7Z6_9GAST|nr:hypothetical protein ElyMa_005007700 [Elysia marginata]